MPFCKDVFTEKAFFGVEAKTEKRGREKEECSKDNSTQTAAALMWIFDSFAAPSSIKMNIFYLHFAMVFCR